MSEIVVGDLSESAVRLIQKLDTIGGRGVAKLLGSVAVALLCPNTIARWSELNRARAKDIDLVFAAHVDPAAAARSLSECGCLLNMDRWLQGYIEESRISATFENVRVEAFFQPLVFYQAIPLASSFSWGGPTLSPEELLISKLQYQIVPRDQLIDLFVMMENLSVDGKAESTGLRCTQFTELMTANIQAWHLWKACQRTLLALRSFAGELKLLSSDLVVGRLAALQSAVINASKGIFWRLRDHIPLRPGGYPVEP